MKLFEVILLCALTTLGFARVRRGLPPVDLKDVGAIFPTGPYKPPQNLQQTSWGAYANYYYELNSNYGQRYAGQLRRADADNVRTSRNINRADYGKYVLGSTGNFQRNARRGYGYYGR